MTQTETFYKLYPDEHIRACRELTSSQRDVLYYLRSRSPFPGANFEVNATEIGKELGIHRTTVSRAIDALKQKGWIAARATAWVVKLNPHNLQLDGECAPTHGTVQPRTKSAPTHRARSPRTDRHLEALPDKDSESLRSIDLIDYKDQEVFDLKDDNQSCDRQPHQINPVGISRLRQLAEDALKPAGHGKDPTRLQGEFEPEVDDV